MTDAEHAAVLRRYRTGIGTIYQAALSAAIERAIEAFAEVERLEDQIGHLVLDGSMVTAALADRRAEIARLVAERDAALAEIERIKEINALNGRRCLAWRACADQLDEALREALSYVPKHFVIKHAIGAEALAEYERLKASQ